MTLIRHKETGQLLLEVPGDTLAGADLVRVVLLCADLHGADLRGAKLRGADLCQADLRGTVLDEADPTRFSDSRMEITPAERQPCFFNCATDASAS